MKLVQVLLISTVLASGSVWAQCQGQGQGPGPGHKHGQGKHCQTKGKHCRTHAGKHKRGHGMAMHHASALPNLMKVVKKHGDQLKLSEEQAKALEAWRARHGAPIHAKAKEIREMEMAMAQAALEGRPKAQLMSMNSRILNARAHVASVKIDCRDNMRRILSPEQYEKVLSIYAGMHR